MRRLRTAHGGARRRLLIFLQSLDYSFRAHASRLQRGNGPASWLLAFLPGRQHPLTGEATRSGRIRARSGVRSRRRAGPSFSQLELLVGLVAREPGELRHVPRRTRGQLHVDHRRAFQREGLRDRLLHVAARHAKEEVVRLMIELKAEREQILKRLEEKRTEKDSPEARQITFRSSSGGLIKDLF